jgi:hypothetical protein
MPRALTADKGAQARHAPSASPAITTHSACLSKAAERPEEKAPTVPAHPAYQG